MKAIGEELKSSREEKGMSLDEVSNDLNITIEELTNLEEGNKSYFTDIYLLKKYIYVYAKYLGLDYDHFISEFDEFMFEYTSKIPVDVIERISKQKEIEEAKKEALSPYTINKNRKYNKKNIIIIGLFLILIIAVIAIFIINNI